MLKAVINCAAFFLLFAACRADWPMAAANPQRTSRNSEEVRGLLVPKWARPIEPYILHRIQLIAARGKIYVSTARGVFALDAAAGAEQWRFETEFPMGHSPTVNEGVLYVGCLDRKIYALDADTGREIWSFKADKGFETNPLVVEGRVYAGCRDGNLYCLDAASGKLVWKFGAGGPICFSAAYQDGVVFFAANDGHAYAVDAGSGALVWKSAMLPGHGFYSHWPVVVGDRVIYAGTHNYRHIPPMGGGGMPEADGLPWRAVQALDVYFEGKGVTLEQYGGLPREEQLKYRFQPLSEKDAEGRMDFSVVLDYYTKRPWLRTYHVLDRATGEEREVAPIHFCGTKGVHNRYPPAVGPGNVLYQFNHYLFGWNPPGQITGWELGSSKISVPASGWVAMDEPLAHSIGGNIIYWRHCNARSAGAIDVSAPAGDAAAGRQREWQYWMDWNEGSEFEEYMWETGALPRDYKGCRFTNLGHADQSPPIPYQGRVYMHIRNSVVCFGPRENEPVYQRTGSPKHWQRLAVPPAALEGAGK